MKLVLKIKDEQSGPAYRRDFDRISKGFVDRYPSKDRYIPEAMQLADEVAIATDLTLADGRANRQGTDWSHYFLNAMDQLLVDAGLRVVPESPRFCPVCGGRTRLRRVADESKAFLYCLVRARECESCGSRAVAPELVSPLDI